MESIWQNEQKGKETIASAILPDYLLQTVSTPHSSAKFQYRKQIIRFRHLPKTLQSNTIGHVNWGIYINRTAHNKHATANTTQTFGPCCMWILCTTLILLLWPASSLYVYIKGIYNRWNYCLNLKLSSANKWSHRLECWKYVMFFNKGMLRRVPSCIYCFIF